MTQINRVPFGFLDLMQAQVSGRAPMEYSNEIRPILDMSAFYFSQRKNATGVSANLVVNGENIITVPDDESWLLYSVANRVLFTAGGGGEVASFTISLERLASDPTPDPNGFPIVGETLSAPGNDTNNVWSSHVIDVPLILLPGERIVQTCQSENFAAARACTLQCGYARMTV